MNNNNELLQVAKIGRLVGLRGELKLNIHCDFPEQFHKNAFFITDKNFDLEIDEFNTNKSTVSFKGYASREAAAKLVNVNLFVTKESSCKECNLEDDEFFWFDIIGSTLEEDVVLGVVKDIQRIGQTDYLIVKTDEKLLAKNLPDLFYVPYIDRYILVFNKETKIIKSRDAMGILENS